MKPGDQFLMLFEVKRLAEPNEIVNGIAVGGNRYQNKWVAEAVGPQAQAQVLVCSDGWIEMPKIPTGLEGGNFRT